MQVEQKLSSNKFVVDEGHPHIVIHQEKMDAAAVQALTVACPAGLYTLDDKGRLAFEVAGCLECGTCRVVTAHLPGAMEWDHPRASFGVQYRFG
jgi:ferredoxin like protein